MNALPSVLPLAPPAIRLPLFDESGRLIGGPRPDGMLAGTIVTAESPKLEALMDPPDVGPPASFKLHVNRETGRLVGGTCRVRATIHDAQTRRALFRVEVPMGNRYGLTLVTWDCAGSVTVMYPSALSASRQVYLVLDDGTTKLGQSIAFRLSELAAAGTDSRLVNDDRSATERIAAAAGNAGRWTGETFNKALWAGGIAGGIVLLMLSRR